MHWQDKAIILGSRLFGENNVILEILTSERGVYHGLVKGGATKAKRAAIQGGNFIEVTWQARLSEQLGVYNFEVLQYNSVKLINNQLILEAFNLFRCYLKLLPLRMASKSCYEMLYLFLQFNESAEDRSSYLYLAELWLRFELIFLQESGVAIDLSSCSATGTKEDLFYVSPRSAQAVCREAGRPYHDKLYILPQFLRDRTKHITQIEEILQANRLLHYFLQRNLWQPNRGNLHILRHSFFNNLMKNLS